MSISFASHLSQNGCAIVVSYNAARQFFEHLMLICSQFSNIVIIDNYSDLAFQLQLQHFSKENNAISVIQNSRNLGIATALNQGVRYAKEHQFDWVMTFDQDTVVMPELLSELTTLYNQATVKPALIGCNYFHATLNRPAVSLSKFADAVERKTLITSGTLFQIQVFDAIGYFRDDYFIDSVDHEFCLRARNHGFRLLMSTKVLMRHSIGRMNTYHRPALFKIPEHSALRKYYITRNCLATVFGYLFAEPVWCVKQFFRLSLELITVIFYERDKIQKIAAMGLGFVHACSSKMGELQNAVWLKKSR